MFKSAVMLETMEGKDDELRAAQASFNLALDKVRVFKDIVSKCPSCSKACIQKLGQDDE